MRRVIAILLTIIVAGGCTYGVIHFLGVGGTSPDNTIIALDGSGKYNINQAALQSYQGYGQSDKDGKITPLGEDDARVQAVSQVAMEWANLVDNRSYETIQGNEEYGLYTEGLIDVATKEDNDIENTQNAYVEGEITTSASNYKITTTVIMPDDRAYVIIKYCKTLLHAKDMEGEIKTGGYDPKTKTRVITVEFEMLKDKNGDYKIYSFNAL